MRYDFELLQKVRAISPGLISLWIAPRISNTHYWRDLCGKYDGKFKYVDGYNNHLDGSSFFDRSGAKGRVGGHSSFAGWRDANETRYVVASSTSGILISRGLATTTWTISAFISTSSGNNATSGKAIYAERANTGNDILKLECGNISNGVNRVGVTIRDDGGTLLQVFPSFSKELVNYRWSHVAGSMNNGTVTSYLDGKYGTGTWTGTSNFTNSNIESWIAADKGDNIAQQHLSNLDCISLHAEYLNPSQLNLLGRILSDGLTSFDRDFPYYLVGEAAAGADTYTGTAAVATSATTCSGSATHTPPSYTGNAAVTCGVATCSGSATHTAPSYTGNAAVTCGAATASGTATNTAPIYTGNAAVTIGAATASGTALFATAVYSGNAAVTCGASTASGSATHTAPIFTGLAAVVAAAVTAAGSATNTTPSYTGNSAVSAGPATASGSATFTSTTRTGTAAVSTAPTTCSGSATFVAPAYDTGTGYFTGLDTMFFGGVL